MRRSAKYRGSYALSVKYKGTAQHYIIKNDNNGGIIIYITFQEIIDQKNLLYHTESKILKLYLGSHCIIDWRGWSTEVKNMYVDKLTSNSCLHRSTRVLRH